MRPDAGGAAQGAFFDVIVIGAGLSGIAAAHHLQTLCPSRSFAILEGRDAIGGTWDLFRYPGIRSDSDMSTLGYSFRPWTSDASFASGPAIRDYVQAAARQEGIEQHIRFGHRVTAANWDSHAARWTVQVTATAGEGNTQLSMTCRFLFFCSGYYDYDKGHAPEWPGRDTFRGEIVHPQHWPAALDWRGKAVVVIGSGATAITLVPELARDAAHVTMVQRSPTYIIALPALDSVGARLRMLLPAGTAYRLVRWKNIAAAMLFYGYSRWRPERVKALIARGARHFLGASFDVERHLSPAYKPWDQRLCVAPDADFFRAIRSGKASIVTAAMQAFTPRGIRTSQGQEIEADVIVTATGLQLKVLGGARLTLDGMAVDPSKSVMYRGTMYSGVPNLAVASGYTNASWTLKCELSARYVCRLLNRMQSKGQDVCVARYEGASQDTQPAIGLTSGYIQRSVALLPRQGLKSPWRMYQNYLLDLATLRFSRLSDGALTFSTAPKSNAPVSH
ncbi:NAD(P)/FAD-dependent oxidoreductase [Caenimonas sp. SL110]|uniref:flavin-containing monooxygenase n=1 Tax=Caenimonas sp. SL110 TaxID=1450524 RepID=UPI000654AF9C|nr:NAD(P)/FAD-dependent oxidoreductase [Caenimonas sp. SL110]